MDDRGRPAVTVARLEVVDSGDAAQWLNTRKGAAAGRGFHYQEAVAALCAARLLDSGVHTLIVPEGSHEDIHCQGLRPVAVQAKSRQNRMGPFPASDVARHLQELHRRRIKYRYKAEAVLAIDCDVKEAPLPMTTVAVGDLPVTHPLVVACDRVITNNGWQAGSFDDIVIWLIPISRARDEAAEIVARVFNVEIPVAERITLEYRHLVCDAADQNAERPSSDPAFIDRTALERVSNRFLSECDPTNLVAAISSGACEPADLDTPTPGDDYFLGVHAQPGHIAAGLPTERADLVESVVAGLSSRGSVLLTGPSGVGKSTVMWMAAFMTRNVTWYRVHRLTAGDVEDLYRLASGRRPTRSAPVGFLVDGVGLGDTEAWDALVRRCAGTPHVYLLGSARVEDTFGLRTLTQSAQIEVKLDDTVAERIYHNLRDAGRTEHPHWREALREANSLTLEYTYLLTQGERLRDVLGEQVRRLVAEPGADAEVQLLALASTAHAHGVELPVGMAGAVLGLSDGDLRRAVGRLKDEHFVVEASGRLTGLHLMRSRALSDAVHLTPPPTISTTIRRLVQNVPGPDVARLIVGVLRDRDDLDNATISAAAARAATDDPRSGLLASVMHAVRSADFIRHARVWADVIKREKVPPAYWPITVNLSLSKAEQLSGLLPTIAAALERLRDLEEEPTPLLDRLIEEITPERIVEVVGTQQTAAGIATLLAACKGAPADLIAALKAQDWSATPAGQCLATCSASEFGCVCSVSRILSDDLAESFVAAAGGESHVVSRIRDMFPTMYEVGRSTAENGTPVAMARLVFIDDELTPSPNDAAKDAATILLRSLGGCVQADVTTVRAGGKPNAHGSLVKFCPSKLEYKYSLTEYETDWNRARSVLVLHELGGLASPGMHAAQVKELLARTVYFFQRLLGLWVTQLGEYLQSDWDWATQERIRLAEKVDDLIAPRDDTRLMQHTIPATGDRLRNLLNRGGTGAPEQVPAFDDDHAHTVLAAVTMNIPTGLMNRKYNLLARCARETVKSLRAMEAAEQWDLAGLDGAPAEIDDLALMLFQVADICAALAEDVIDWRNVVKQARSAPRASALTFAAEAARAASRRRMENLLQDLKSTLSSHGVIAQVLQKDADPYENYWPHFDLAVVVKCTDIDQWWKQVSIVQSAILDLRKDLDLPPPTLVCPDFRGRREPALAFDMQKPTDPLSQRYQQWFGDQQATHALLEAVERASLAILRRSGLHYLESLRPLTTAFQAAYDDTAVMFEDALEQVRAQGDDPVIDFISEMLSTLMDLVESEHALDGIPGAVADQILDRNPEGPIALTPAAGPSLAKMFAVLWTHDPAEASSLLAGKAND